MRTEMRANPLLFFSVTLAMLGLLSLPLAAQPATAPAAPTVVPVTGTPAAPAVPATGGTQVPTQLNVNPPASVPVASAPIVPAIPPVASVTDTAKPAAPAAAAGNTDIASDPAVTAVIDRLKQNTNPLSLGDMAAAQDTLARLNLLGEIEQKLSQIETSRNQREGTSLPGMGAMPNLPMPPISAPSPSMPNMQAMAAMNMDSGANVEHISGTNGKYNAVIKTDGRQMVVRQGSVLPDGAKVIEINAGGVKIKTKNGHMQTLSFLDDSTPDSK